MYNKINYTIVGVFVLLFSAGAIWFAIWLGKYDEKERYKYYKIYFTESVTGLTKDSAVKLKGVDIGRVESIRIDPNDISRVEVIVKIKEDVPIKEDMVAHLELLGVTGLQTIIIEGGSNEARDLVAKDGELPVIKSQPSWFYKTKSSITQIGQESSELLKRINMLLSPQNINRFNELLEKAIVLEKKSIEGIDEAILMARDVRVSMKELKEKLEVSINNFNRIAKSISKDLKRVNKEIIPLIKRIRVATNNFNRAIVEIDRGLKRGDYNLKRIFDPLIVDLRLVTDELNYFIREVESSPSDLLFEQREIKRGPGE